LGLLKEAILRILLTCLILAGVAVVLMIFHAERQQEAALDALSNYKLMKPQPVLHSAGVSPTPLQAAGSAEDD
jgi:hypothetical protein